MRLILLATLAILLTSHLVTTISEGRTGMALAGVIMPIPVGVISGAVGLIRN